jgi:hypothetical protein
LTERHLTGEAQQHVKADAGKRRGRQRPEQKSIIAGREKTDRSSGDADQHRGNESNRGSHTRTLVRPPNNPDGASTRAAITAEKVTIWVLLEPSQVVAQASTNP